MTKLYDYDGNVISSGGQHAVNYKQELPDDFIQNLRDEKAESHRPAKDMHRVASIPVALADHWLRQGYDVMQEPVAKTLKKLREENLEDFITTSKDI